VLLDISNSVIGGAFQLKRRRTSEATLIQHFARRLPAANKICPRKPPLNTIRMFVFAIAVLSAAFLSRAIADFFSPDKPIPTANTAHSAPASADPQSAADRKVP
jgi:hypothetical protein